MLAVEEVTFHGSITFADRLTWAFFAGRVSFPQGLSPSSDRLFLNVRKCDFSEEGT